MPLKTDLNVTPYYDDFDETNNYNRILFKPSVAVQARELTQLQTILQDQIEKFGNHIFKEGSIVSGCTIGLDNSVHYIRVFNKDFNGANVSISTFANTNITGLSFGVRARVLKVHDGSQANTPSLKTMYLKYTSSGNTSGIMKRFTPGEKVYETANTAHSANVFTTFGSTGNSSIFTVSSGVLYARGHFIYVPTQSLVIGRFTSNTDARVGFTVEESISTSSDDSTLTDPAAGSYNYAAPGADRLKLSAVLSTRTFAQANTDDFFEIAQIANGQYIRTFDKTQYSSILDEMAKRTYDQSGDFLVDPFSIVADEHLYTANNGGYYKSAFGGSKDKLIVSVGSGKAYVRGYEYQNRGKFPIHISKANTSLSLAAQEFEISYGNYVYINSVSGEWDINNLSQVSLHGTAIASTPTSTSIGKFTSNTSNYNTDIIGTARVRSIQYDSGNFFPDGTARYKLYLFDIKITGANKSFANTKAISATTVNSSSGNRGFGNIVRDSSIVWNQANPAPVTVLSANLKEKDLDVSIFPIPINAIKRLRTSAGAVNATIVYSKAQNVTIASGGTFTLSLINEQFNSGTGLLSDSASRQNFYVALTANATASMTGTITIGKNSNTITGSSTLFTREFRNGDILMFGSNNYVHRIVTIASNTSLSITPYGPISKAGLTFKKVFPKGQVIDLGYNADSSSFKNRTVTVGSSTSTTFDLKETFDSSVSANVIFIAKKTSAREASKLLRANRYVKIRANTHPRTTSGPWELGFSDVFSIQEVRLCTSLPTTTTAGTVVTENFELDDGQRDNLYATSKIKKKSTSSLSIAANDFLLVKFAVFQHDYTNGFGYFSVDSYPIDDNNLANTAAIHTAQIPTYVSTVDGTSYNLRNSIDIRPAFTATSNIAGSLVFPANTTTNPANSTSISVASGYARVLFPNEVFTSDLSYYLPRIDKLFLDTSGNFVISTGTPSLRPTQPDDIGDAMKLATIFIPAYPSLSQQFAKILNTNQGVTTVKLVNARRYTMRDIGKIKDSVTRLEHQTLINMTEAEALSKQILNSSGIDRYKNGLFADSFTSFDKSNLNDRDFNASIDTVANVLRPKVDVFEVTLDYNASESSNIVRRAKDAVLVITGATGTFTVGETITSSGGATGKLVYAISTTKLVLEKTTGTFVAGQTIVGKGATISTVTLPSESSVLTLPYTHELAVEQPYATKVRNAAGEFYYFFFKGVMTLDPASDTWVDTTYAPDINNGSSGGSGSYIARQDKVSLGAVLAGSESGSIPGLSTTYGAWTKTIDGLPVVETLASGTQIAVLNGTFGTNIKDAVGGITAYSSVNPGTTVTRETSIWTGPVSTTWVDYEDSTQLIDDRVISNSLSHYMRSRIIKIKADGLKPTTRHFLFMDDYSLSAYMTPTNSSFVATGSEGTAVLSDSTGTLTCTYRIPDNAAIRFRTGNHVIRLIDNISPDAGFVSSSVDSNYVASGSIQTRQRSYVTTQVATTRTSTETVSLKHDSLRLQNGQGAVLINGDGNRQILVPTQTVERNTVAAGGTGTSSSAIPQNNNGGSVVSLSTTTPATEPTGNGSSDQTNTYTVLAHERNAKDLGYNADGLDPIAQSFSIPGADYASSGVFLTKIDLYFKKKSSTLPIIVEIREMQNGFPTTSVIPGSTVVATASTINTSSDGSNASTFWFSSPVYIKVDTEYCFIIKPAGNNPDYEVWLSELGGKDLLTNKVITEQPYIGVCYTSSNDKAWTIQQSEDVKFRLYVANFSTGTTGAVILKNETTNYLNVSNVSSDYYTSETVSGEIRLFVRARSNTSAGSTSGVGSTVKGLTSGASGVVTVISGAGSTAAGSNNAMFRLRNVLPSVRFTVGENVRFANGAIAVAIQSYTPSGRIKYFADNYANAQMHIANTVTSVTNSSGSFSATNKYGPNNMFVTSEQLTGHTSLTKSFVSTIDNLLLNTLYTNVQDITFANTTLTYSTKSSSSSALDSTYADIVNRHDQEFISAEKRVFSKINEVSTLNGSKSLSISASMVTNNKYLSPLVDIQRASAYVIGNIINNVVTNETNSFGGLSKAKYLTKRIILGEGQDSDDLKVYITAFKPNTSDIKIYVKFLNSEDNTLFEDVGYTQLSQSSNSNLYSDSKSRSDLIEYEYSIPSASLTGTYGEFQYTSGTGAKFTGYKYFAIKVVMTSSVTYNPPALKDIRAIALLV